MRLRYWPVLVTMLIGIICASCGQNAPTPTPTSPSIATTTPSPSPFPTATPTLTAPPSPTPSPTPTPTPAPQPISAETLAWLKPVDEQPWQGYHGLLQSIAWSPDGTKIAGQLAGGMPRIAVWDAQDLHTIALFPQVTFRQWLSDGRMLARDAQGHYILYTLGQEEGEPLDLAPFGDAQITDVRISPTGRFIVALAAPRTVLVYEPSTQTLQQYDVPWDKRAIIDLNFGMVSPDEDWLFLWGRAGLPPYAFTVVISLHQKRLYATYEGMLLRLSPEHNRVLVLDQDLSVKVAFTGDVLSALSMGVFRYDPESQSSNGWIAVDTDFASQLELGMLFAHYNPPFDAQMILRDISSREILKTIPLRQIAGAAQIAFSPDRERFATASHDGYLRIWDTEGQMLAEARVADNTAELFSEEIPMPKIAPDGEHVALPDGFQGIAIFTLPNSQPDFVLPRTEQDGLTYIPFDFDFVNDHLLIDTMPEGVHLWNLDTQKVTHTYMQGSAWGAFCKADAQADLLICSSSFIALVDGQTQSILTQLADSRTTRSYVIQPQGEFVALCNAGGEAISLWQTHPVQHRPNLLLTLGGKPAPACGDLHFSGDGRYLISSTGGIWEVESGEQVGEFPPIPIPTSPAPEVAPPPPSSHVGTTAGDFFWIYDTDDHSLALYRLPDGQHIRTLTLPDDTLAFRFAEDGMRLVVVQTDRITTWQAVP